MWNPLSWNKIGIVFMNNEKKGFVIGTDDGCLFVE